MSVSQKTSRRGLWSPLWSYHFLPSVRGDFLAKLGRFDKARAELERAATLTRNTRERDLCTNASGRASLFQPVKLRRQERGSLRVPACRMG
jgi:hypothetical protein